MAARRLQAIFSIILIRRRKDSLLNGKRLIELPPRTVSVVTLEFSEEEAAIYAFVEKKSQFVFNRFLQAGTVLKNYGHIFAMLTRLRQIAVHPCLIAQYASAFEVVDTRSPEMKSVVEQAAQAVSMEFVALVKKRLKQKAVDAIEAEKRLKGDASIDDECPICMDALSEEAVVAAPCAHFLYVLALPSLIQVNAALSPFQLSWYAPNALLHSPFFLTKITECITAHINKPRPEEEKDALCPMCRTAIFQDQIYTRKAYVTVLQGFAFIANNASIGLNQPTRNWESRTT